MVKFTEHMGTLQGIASMSLKRTTLLKTLLVIVPALLLAFVVQPAIAQAETYTVTYEAGEGLEIKGDQATSEQVVSGKSPTNVPTTTNIDPYRYMFWTADVGIYVERTGYFAAGTPFRADQIYSAIVTSDITFTAQAYPGRFSGFRVVYITDGNGSVSHGYELVMSGDDGKLKNIPTLTPNAGYLLDYWVADTAVELDGDNVSAGTHLTADQMNDLSLNASTTFTAHFKHTATVTYTTDGNGEVPTRSEEVVLDTTAYQDATEVAAGLASSISASANTHYEFAYWTANVDVYEISSEKLVAVPANTELNTTSYYVTGPTTYTAHFKRVDPYTITYTVDENGDEFPTGANTESVDEGSSPTDVPTPYAKDPTKYTFAYWTADVAVTLNDGTTIDMGKPITYDQVGEVKVTSDITFTAHFRQKTCTVIYKPGEGGKVTKTDEQLTLGTAYDLSDGSGTVFAARPSGAAPVANKNYVFDGWTWDVDVYEETTSETSSTPVMTPVSAAPSGSALDEDLPSYYYVAGDVTYTAHFKKVRGVVTYETDGNGSVKPTSETVAFTEQVINSQGDKAMAGTPTGSATTPNKDYEFAYWTSNVDVIKASDLSIISAEDPITNEQLLSGLLITKDATFTAHFKQTTPLTYTVTYTSAGNGSVNPTSEQVAEGDSPKGPTTITPDAGFEFSHWTADKDVVVANEDATQAISLTANDNEAEPQAATTTITAGDTITSEQFSRILVADDVEFEAHFKEIKVDPEPEPKPVDPDNPDGGDTIKPTDGTTGKLTPKTGDTLPGATTAVALGAGVAVAGAALLKKRCR